MLILKHQKLPSADVLIYYDHQAEQLFFITLDADFWWAGCTAAPVLWKLAESTADTCTAVRWQTGVAPPRPVWWQIYSQKTPSPWVSLLRVVASPPVALTLIHNPLRFTAELSHNPVEPCVQRVQKEKKRKKNFIRTEVAALICCRMFSRSR